MTRLRTGLLVGLAVGVLLTLAGAGAYGLLVHDQDRQTEREFRWAAARGDVAGPIGCGWTYTLTNGHLSTGLAASPTTATKSPGSPAAAGSPGPPANTPGSPGSPIVTTGTAGPAGGPPGLPLVAAMERVASGGPAETITMDGPGTEYHIRTQAVPGGAIQVVIDARDQLADRRHLLWAIALAAVIGLVAALAAGHRAAGDAFALQHRFLTEASHELRTPIAQVQARAQLIARRAPAGEGRRDLDRLVGSTRRLGEIVDELLQSARLAAGPGSPRQPVDLTALATAAVTGESARAAERSVHLTLAAPDGPAPVRGVASALQRVVSELLANALSHTPPGGRITVAVRTAGDQVELAVADDGDGFDPADAGRLFDRFHRGAGGDGHRFGIGLALLREVVTSHGGTIEADGRPGDGATFVVRLPRMPSPEPPGRPDRWSPPCPAGIAPPNRP